MKVNMKLSFSGLRLLMIPSLVMLATPAMAQQAPNPSPIAVEMAVPFGTVPGKVLLLGDHMVFLDEQQPEASIVIPKGAIERLTVEAGLLVIQTKEPVRGRSGALRSLNLRLSAGGDPAIVTTWFGGGAAKSAPVAPPAPTSVATAETGVYQARHDHRIGACKGRLLLMADQIAYESVDEVDHSRRWEYKAIKEVKLSNPYELEVKPFSGAPHKVFLDGSGMDAAAFKTLEDRVVAARTKR